MYNVKKKNLFGCFKLKKFVTKTNETGLKEGNVIKID